MPKAQATTGRRRPQAPITSREDAIGRATAKQQKYGRNTSVVEFIDVERQTSRYKVYFTSDQGRAVQDCEVGEQLARVGRVLKGYGWLEDAKK
jgi:hypothetical protein